MPKPTTKNYYAAFLFFAIFWLAFLGFSGTLTSGYHLTDDHEIVRINNDLKSESTLAVAEKWMKNDQFGTHRFRPFYILHRTLETKVFGTNFTAWSLYTAILAIATSFFLFYFLYLLEFSFWESLLFSLASLIGVQATIWWRLGPNETIGMAMLSLSLFFLGKYVVSEAKAKTFKILFVVFAILSALSKESFLLLLPAFILLLVYLDKIKSELDWKEVIKKNIGSIGVLAIVFVGCVGYIKMFIGTGGTGYAGVAGPNLKAYGETFWDLSKKTWLSYLILTQTLVILFFSWKEKSQEKMEERVRKIAFPVIIFLAVVLPQVFLHMKSGFMKRYLVPVMLAYALAFVFSLRKIRKINQFFWTAMILLALIFVAVDTRTAFSDAQAFTQEGKSLKSIFATIKAKTSTEANILIVGDPIANAEWNGSLRDYLFFELERKNVFLYALSRKTPTGFAGNIMPDAIILFPRMEKVFLENYSSQDFLENYLRQDLGGYVIYYKN